MMLAAVGNSFDRAIAADLGVGQLTEVGAPVRDRGQSSVGQVEDGRDSLGAQQDEGVDGHR